MRKSIPCLLFLGLAACQQPDLLTGDPSVKVISAEQASTCAPLRTVTTTTGVFGNIGRAKAMELARNETQATAGAGGANAMVFTMGGPGDDGALFVEAKTFIC